MENQFITTPPNFGRKTVPPNDLSLSESSGKRTKADCQFKGKGLGVKDKSKPVSVMLPPELDAIVKALPNRSEWLREAIREKLKRDGLLL